MIYRFVIFLLWPAFFIYTIKLAIRDRSKRYFLQRLGFAYKQQDKKNIWIHCASVGEVNTYFPLHLKLLEKYPDKNFIITTNTCTGGETVKRHNAPRTHHCFLPIESAFAINRFLSRIEPAQCIIMETEIWPMLYQSCHRRNIPLNIINARLSHRTLKSNRWIKSIYRKSLATVNKILCKSDTELENFVSLGAHKKQLVVAGNLKFTSIDKPATKTIDLSGRPYCLAASTHNNEEQQLAELWIKLNSDRLLVIVPRHPNRSTQIQKQLSRLKVKYATRSLHQPIDNYTQVYLADTLGELDQFMINAEFVFIGGSLIKHGGQNILEPARLGKATVCGPHMFNFKDELDLLLANQACLQVKTIDELEAVFVNLLNHPDQVTALGDRAKEVLDQQSDILNHYLEHLRQ